LMKDIVTSEQSTLLKCNWYDHTIQEIVVASQVDCE